jgi:hypothetical protein
MRRATASKAGASCALRRDVGHRLSFGALGTAARFRLRQSLRRSTVAFLIRHPIGFDRFWPRTQPLVLNVTRFRPLGAATQFGSDGSERLKTSPRLTEHLRERAIRDVTGKRGSAACAVADIEAAQAGALQVRTAAECVEALSPRWLLGIVGRRALFVLGVRLKMRSRIVSCAVLSTIGRSSAKLRRSPFTAYWRAGNNTLRPRPSRRSQTLKPINFSPASGDRTCEMELDVGELTGSVAAIVRRDLDDQVGVLVGPHGSVHTSLARARRRLALECALEMPGICLRCGEAKTAVLPRLLTFLA